jgi:acyl carrier protein
MQESLEGIVLSEFRRALLMAPEEDIPLDASFFDMGLTSLALTEVKQRLEVALNCTISARTLFNQPTVARLLEHLTQDVPGDPAGQRAGTEEAPAPGDAGQTQWDDVLNDLYQR